jgi:O-antigen/teichoic acid export membrane protein
LDSVSEIFLSLQIRDGKFGVFAFVQCINGLTTVALIYVMLRSGVEASFALAGSALGSVAGISASIWFGRRFLQRTDGDTKLNVKLIKQGLTLGGGNILDTLCAVMPRLFLDRVVNGSAVANYTILASLQQGVGSTYGLAQSQTLLPRLGRAHYEGSLKRFLWHIVVGAIGATVFAVVMLGVYCAYGDEVILLLFGPNYLQIASIVPLVLISTWLWLIVGVLSHAFTAKRWLNVQPFMFGLMFLSTLLALIFLVPRFGVAGAVMSTLTGLGVRGLGYACLFAYRVNRGPMLYADAKSEHLNETTSKSLK